MTVETRLEGIDELLIKFKSVSEDVQGKSTRFALRKASTTVLKPAVVGEYMRVDKESTREAIWRNVVIRNAAKRYQKQGELKTRLGILGGARTKKENDANPGGDTFYWRFLEFGTSRVPAKRYITRTVQRKQAEFFKVFQTEMGKSLDRAIKRAQKKAKQNVPSNL